MERREVPVLVVGAGPVGLMAAILLGRRGVDTLVVDRRDGPHRAPQAHVVNPRTLEICRAAGLDMARLRERATRREDGGHVVWLTTLAGDELGRLPYERQGDDALAYTPTPLLNLSQHLFEPLLLDEARATGRATVRWRHEWHGLQQDADGVTARVRDLASGRSDEVRSRWLLAADGAGSRIRTALGIDMTGPERVQSFVMIHFEADLRALVRDRPGILYWTLDPQVGAFVAHDIDRTWVFMHAHDPDVEPAGTFTEARCAQIVRRAIGAASVRFAIRDVSPWTMTAQIAERYGAGRTFLVGDSAHRFPPTGGLGMNTGIQDAHNLVWKLCAIDDGWAPAALLGSYEVERRPVAARNAEQSLANALRMLEVFEALGFSPGETTPPAGIAARLADPAQRERLRRAIANQQEHFDLFGLQLGFTYEAGAVMPDGSAMPACANPARDFVPTSRPGSRLPHAWIQRCGATLSTLDLVPYDRFTLLAGPDGCAWVEAAAAVAASPVRCLVAGRDFEDPTGLWEAVAGTGRHGALLVRPDQHVAWRSPALPANTAAALADAVAAVLGGGSAVAPGSR
jgi:2,4-dichlorophenol 6-monooxygenase